MRRLSPILLLALCAFAPQTPPQITALPVVLAGESPRVVVSGLEPNEEVRLHAVQRVKGAWTQGADGRWSQGQVTLDAWADFHADQDGRIALDTATPDRGSYRKADGLGLLWSGYKQGDAKLYGVGDERLYQGLEPGAVNISLLRGGEIAARAQVKQASVGRGVAFTPISQPGLTGVFAAPEGAQRLPVIISLHGSEGGSVQGARDRAAQFASRGYAVLAINYFSWLGEDPNTAGGHIEVPIETIAKAREWLAVRPEADVERFAVYGVSKGAEFGLVAAQRYPWIDAVVACVPTDLVWEGYGPEQWTSVGRSSWSFEGAPLPFVPVYPRIQPEEGDRDNTGRYDRSLRELGDAGGQARIAVERIEGRVLLLGSDRDGTWSSGPMIRRLQARADAAGRGDHLEAQIYPEAGHQICGSGSFPARLYSDQSSSPWVEDVTAAGEATIDGWARTLDFLERTVGPPHAF